MEQTPNIPVARRARHQQRRDNIKAELEKAIQRQLTAARDSALHLDLEVHLNAGIKRHVRVAAVSNGVLTGTALGGFADDTPRQTIGEIVIRLSAIAMVERIVPAGTRP
jgi:hypothetical protein